MDSYPKNKVSDRDPEEDIKMFEETVESLMEIVEGNLFNDPNNPAKTLSNLETVKFLFYYTIREKFYKFHSAKSAEEAPQKLTIPILGVYKDIKIYKSHYNSEDIIEFVNMAGHIFLEKDLSPLSGVIHTMIVGGDNLDKYISILKKLEGEGKLFFE